MKPAWRHATLVALALVALWCTSGGVAAQKWTQGQTPDGQPDIQGIWINFDSTPFETPVAQPQAAGSTAATGVGPASEFADHDHKVSQRRKAMVVDPPDGRVPVMKWAEDKRDYDLEHIPDAPEHETPWVRCITRGHPAGMFPAGYNNAYEFIQIPGYVVMVFEMIHETRIIPLDGRPRLGDRIKQWNGEPRGRWEGDTLVVETTNFHPKGNPMGGYNVLSDEHLRLVERFRRTADDTIEYTFTVDNPTMWTKPWTAVINWKRSRGELLEYACHEGNYSLRGMLSAARAEEAAGKR